MAQIINEDGTPIVDVPTTPRTDGPYANFGTPHIDLGTPRAFTVRDLTGGKHPLRTKTGWRVVGIVALMVAIVVGLIALSVMALVFVVPALVLVGLILWVRSKFTGKGVGGSGRGRGSVMTTS
ncbi:hypothetical protein CLV47_12834 [Antricoccus suffuscus]|uniref:Uncharacterized protein n=1 Tax=Antricoccus suffuscus TaxID=1629062 RepID=A0A2T0Z4Y2_9ACTN|nr:hypothetical protein [Antricoccus suffuscus]PRZ31396.1 hypothetical protein CLV47_12834 [Antricoccus suffuscus]